MQNKIGLLMCKGSSRAVAKRSRGTPRIAIRTLRRVRDHAEKASLTEGETETILDKLGMSRDGLDGARPALFGDLENKNFMGVLLVFPLCSALSEAKDTIELNVEPFLIRKGCVMKKHREVDSLLLRITKLNVIFLRSTAGQIEYSKVHDYF